MADGYKREFGCCTDHFLPSLDVIWIQFLAFVLLPVNLWLFADLGWRLFNWHFRVFVSVAECNSAVGGC